MAIGSGVSVAFPVLTPADFKDGREVVGYFSQSTGQFFHFSSRTQLPDDTVRVRASDLEDGPHASFVGRERMDYEQAVLRKIKMTSRASKRNLPFLQPEHTVQRQAVVRAFRVAYMRAQVQQWGELDSYDFDQEVSDFAQAEGEAEGGGVINKILGFIKSILSIGQAKVKGDTISTVAEEGDNPISATLQWLRSLFMTSFKNALKRNMNIINIFRNNFMQEELNTIAFWNQLVRRRGEELDLDMKPMPSYEAPSLVSDTQRDAELVLNENTKQKSWMDLARTGMSYLGSGLSTGLKAVRSLGMMVVKGLAKAISLVSGWIGGKGNMFLTVSFLFNALQHYTCLAAGKKSNTCDTLNTVVDDYFNTNFKKVTWDISAVKDKAKGALAATATTTVAAATSGVGAVAAPAVKVATDAVVDLVPDDLPVAYYLKWGWEAFERTQMYWMDTGMMHDESIKNRLGWSNAGLESLNALATTGKIQPDSFLDDLSKIRTENFRGLSALTMSSMTAYEMLLLVEEPEKFEEYINDGVRRLIKSVTKKAAKDVKEFVERSVKTTYRLFESVGSGIASLGSGVASLFTSSKDDQGEAEKLSQGFWDNLGWGGNQSEAGQAEAEKKVDDVDPELIRQLNIFKEKHADSIEMLRRHVNMNRRADGTYVPEARPIDVSKTKRLFNCAKPFNPVRDANDCVQSLSDNGIDLENVGQDDAKALARAYGEATSAHPDLSSSDAANLMEIMLDMDTARNSRDTENEKKHAERFLKASGKDKFDETDSVVKCVRQIWFLRKDVLGPGKKTGKKKASAKSNSTSDTKTTVESVQEMAASSGPEKQRKDMFASVEDFFQHLHEHVTEGSMKVVDRVFAWTRSMFSATGGNIGAFGINIQLSVGNAVDKVFEVMSNTLRLTISETSEEVIAQLKVVGGMKLMISALGNMVYWAKECLLGKTEETQTTPLPPE